MHKSIYTIMDGPLLTDHGWYVYRELRSGSFKTTDKTAIL
jgi:hypothetical protein